MHMNRYTSTQNPSWYALIFNPNHVMIIPVIPSVLRHGGFHSHVAIPRAGCFIIEFPLKIGLVYLEYSYFRKPPYGRFWCMLRYLLMSTNLKQPRAMFASPKNPSQLAFRCLRFQEHLRLPLLPSLQFVIHYYKIDIPKKTSPNNISWTSPWL